MNEDNVRKTYRLLLKKYHPDTGGENADEDIIKQLIYDYKKLSKQNKDKPEKTSPIAISRYSSLQSAIDIDNFILKMVVVIYQHKTHEIPKDTIINYIDNLKKFYDGPNLDNKTLHLTSLIEIANLSNQIEDGYNVYFEKSVKQITEYARNIAEATNYLEQLSAVSNPKQRLIQSILQNIKLSDNYNMRLLLNAYLVWIISLEI